ncbi:transmembrane protein 72 isoform 2-T2 [Menidia menidia]
MGNSESVWWSLVEGACRILGVSTATVLCGVGIETVHEGRFSSLGIYLLTSSVGIMMFELAYFLDYMLSMCLPCPPDWQFFQLWGKMARVGGFHKFLYYSIMSVVCFLHPVLVWHATIPVTGQRREELPVSDKARCLGLLERGESVQAMLEEEQRAESEGANMQRKRWWKKRRPIWLKGREEPVEREMEEMEEYNEPEPGTTSDTAPMITD